MKKIFKALWSLITHRTKIFRNNNFVDFQLAKYLLLYFCTRMATEADRWRARVHNVV